MSLPLAVAVPANSEKISYSTEEDCISQDINVQEIKKCLNKHDWPETLQVLFLEKLKITPIRYIIIDDSGSMGVEDGEIFSFNTMKTIIVPRYQELKNSLLFFQDVINSGNIKTVIKPLNKNYFNGDGINNLDHIITPCGGTPLLTSINGVINEISKINHILIQNNMVVSVIIATDGEASDGSIEEMKASISKLMKLKVHVVIRLCTNEEKIIKYWNSIDDNIEESLDILDGYYSEAKEVYKNNKCIGYGLPLHQFREFGLYFPAFDLIDEHKINNDTKEKFAKVLTGMNDLSDKQEVIRRMPMTMCPIRKKRVPFLKIKEDKCVIF